MAERASTLAVWVLGEGGAEAARSARGAHEVRLIADESGAALNELLAATDADYLVLLDAATTAAPAALELLAAALDRFSPDAAYGDSTGVPRPVASPLRLRSQDYWGGLRAFSVQWLRESGGFSGRSGGHAFELALRAVEVLHVPEVLTTSIGRTTEPAVHSEIVAAQLGAAAVITARADGSRTVEYALTSTPLVSIIIPTRGGSATIRGRSSVLVVDAVRGVLEHSTYPELEVVIVADDATPQAVVDELRAVGGDRLRIVRWSEPFDFSAKINRGAAVARGEFLLVLNDDVELITPEWIEVMLGLAQQPGVGLVGTMLQFEDGSIQHGGHLYRDLGAGHIAFRWPIDRDDALGSLGVDREVSGVTAACALVSAETFRAVGGFSTLFPGNYNDVDFCLKVRSTGRSIVWTPRARLYHFESKTRVATIAPVELERLRERWSEKLLVDPYWP